jgi:hypothetical protein
MQEFLSEKDHKQTATVRRLQNNLYSARLVKWRTLNADSRLPMQSVKPDIHDGVVMEKETVKTIVG